MLIRMQIENKYIYLIFTNFNKVNNFIYFINHD